ncbi:MAG: carboxypeptidase-like regulatory domain-containing protein [Janthinobacterium lividum]
MKSVFMITGLAAASLGCACAQQAPLRGTVLDAQSQPPLPGVTVVVPGTQMGTTTEAGHFVLPASVVVREISTSFIGYNT